MIKKHDTGVTMVELLVSIFIFTFLVVMLVQLSQDATGRQRSVADYTFATMAANNIMELLKASPVNQIKFPEPSQDMLADDNLNQLRESNAEYHVEKFREPSLYKITVTVSWKDMKGRNKHLELTSLKEFKTNVEEE